MLITSSGAGNHVYGSAETRPDAEPGRCSEGARQEEILLPKPRDNYIAHDKGKK